MGGTVNYYVVSHQLPTGNYSYLRCSEPHCDESLSPRPSSGATPWIGHRGCYLEPLGGPYDFGVTERRRLVVLFGGRSAEHDVSCVSARHVVAAADPQRYEVIPVGIRRDGRWCRVVTANELLAEADLPDALDPSGPAWDPLQELPQLAVEGTVAVFPLIHGPLGEDGTIQGLLEVADVAYVGSGVLGSALAMNKLAAKEMLDHYGIPQADYRGLRADDLGVSGTDSLTSLLKGLLDDLGPVVFVKPANLGSSIGISKANDPVTLERALRTAADYDEWLVVERAVEGREIELAVLGDLVPQVSGPGEIRPGGDFYDYVGKYEDASTELIDEPDLAPETTVKFQELAARAFLALHCSGMARVDFFLDPNRGPVLNEVNTIPGFTPISMYPRLWQRAGLSYPALVDRLVDLAVARHARRRRNTDR